MGEHDIPEKNIWEIPGENAVDAVAQAIEGKIQVDTVRVSFSGTLRVDLLEPKDDNFIRVARYKLESDRPEYD